MNELKIFENAEFGKVRTVVVDGDPMFCLTDICRALDLTQPSKVKERLNEKGVNSIPTLTSGGKQNLLYVNESNLYKTIFQSRKESAEKFTEWVTSEVLPSVRKHGAYMTPETIEKTLSDPDFIIRLATELKEEKALRNRLQDKVEQDRPKVLFADAVSASQTSILIGDLAKLLKQNGVDTGQKRLFARLREEGYLIKGGSSKNMPTQKAMEMGLFEVKEGSYVDSNGCNITTKTTKVSGKGQIYFINRYRK